ncbi:hypothetical protein AMAG_07334 [Allomyces macrogynus ATCC 38327]|uniref:Uncharacterized protein n=1 Tax=Allomyces macrogynus (strain ATCC 38327) TaxID=578462 RepID=A0A0L0SIC0_ALLM3|nr:hypothetical protein AMAG_07334 [Allomyces macrogynus ATCC 38327]|eukprot:KNE62080.1 hypothetical protein AMAG_07334 [Allomyces macrogynus ATCC 38327]
MRTLARALAATIITSTVRRALLARTTRAATAPHPIRALATARPTPNPAPAASASSQTNPTTGEPYMDLDATSNRGYGSPTIDDAGATAADHAETRLPRASDTASASAPAKSTAKMYGDEMHAEPVRPMDPRHEIDVEEANAAAMDHHLDGPDIDQDGTFQDPAAFSDG